MLFFHSGLLFRDGTFRPLGLLVYFTWSQLKHCRVGQTVRVISDVSLLQQRQRQRHRGLSHEKIVTVGYTLFLQWGTVSNHSVFISTRRLVRLDVWLRRITLALYKSMCKGEAGHLILCVWSQLPWRPPHTHQTLKVWVLPSSFTDTFTNYRVMSV